MTDEQFGTLTIRKEKKECLTIEISDELTFTLSRTSAIIVVRCCCCRVFVSMNFQFGCIVCPFSLPILFWSLHSDSEYLKRYLLCENISYYHRGDAFMLYNKSDFVNGFYRQSFCQNHHKRERRSATTK